MNDFLSFLAVNDYQKKDITYPDEVLDPDKDEAAINYFSELAEFGNQEYYLLNGIQDEGDMEVELDRLFKQFKMYALENKIKEQKEWRIEIIDQLNDILREIQEQIHQVKGLKSRTLETLYKQKLSYAQDAHEFLKIKSNKKPSKVFYSYKWLKNPEIPIPKAYNLMVGRLISAKTTLEDFQKIFSKKPIGEVQPLCWFDEYINGVVFFVVRMKEKEVICDGNEKNVLNIQLLKTCFRNSSGEEFQNKYVNQTKFRMHKDISPKKKDFIENIINEIMS